MQVASFHVRATVAQGARWKVAAESEAYASVGQWLAAAADAYLRIRARAGLPVPLAWRRGRFAVQLDGEARKVAGHVAAPTFGVFHGDGRGEARRGTKTYTLVHLADGRLIATFRYFREARAFASDLARQWLREEGRQAPVLP